MKRAIQSCVLIAVLVMSTLFGSGLLGTISPASAASSLSWLHTEGKHIKNQAGQIVFLRGVALPDLANGLWWNGGTGKLDLIQTLLDGKVNVVRCVISPYPDGSLSYWPNNPGVFDPSIDQLVNFATANNIYVIIEFDGLPWGSSEVFRMQSNPNDWINWVLHFVNRYKSTPTVAGFEIWNEPSSADFTQAKWRSIATQCYSAIQAANPNALVIIPSIPFGEVSQDWINNPLGPQAVYGWDDYWFHADYSWFRAPYDEGNSLLGLQRMKQYLSYKNLDANIPIIDTESGWLPTDNLAAVNDWYNILNAAETSWYTFSWLPNPDNYGLYDGATNTLTPQAKVMKNYLVSTAAPSLASIQVQVSGGGVTNPAAGTYQWPIGSTQILLATPNSGSSFNHWDMTGGATSNANPLSFTINGDGYAKAVFIVNSPPSGSESSGVFGYQTVGSANVGADKPIGSAFACSAAGIAKSLSVAVRSSSSVALSLKGAIYRQSDMSLVAVTGEVSVPAWFEGWQTLSFDSQRSVSAGVNYVLMAFSSTVGGDFLSVYYSSGAGQGLVQGGFTYPNFPSVLSPSVNNLQCSIYCTYTTSSSSTPTPTPTSGVFGSQAIGNGNEGANRIIGSVFACSQAGSAASLSVAVRSSSGVALSLRGAIYSQSDMALVGVTGEVSVPAWFEGWQTLSFSPQPTLSAGTNYVLMIFSETAGGDFLSVYYNTGSGTQGVVQGGLTYPNFPGVLSPNMNSLQCSIYCSYTSG